MSIEARLRLARADFMLDVAVEIRGRGVTGLFGRSGSGKTTLLRCLAGLERAEGELRVGGEIWQGAECFVPPHRRALGYVFQEARLFSHLSVRGNLEYGFRRLQAAARRVRLDEVIDLLALAPLLERAPESLSGGQRQRVAIGRALLRSPRLLLMDEPLASLDLASRQEILPYLARLHDELEIPLVYVSHSPQELARLADYVLTLEAGRVRGHDRLAEWLTRPELAGEQGAEAAAALDAVVLRYDADARLNRLRFAGGELLLPGAPLPVGARVRIGVAADDVALALTPPQAISIVNVLPARVLDLHPQDDAAKVLVRLVLGDSVLLSRITAYSAAKLKLAPGRAVHALVKGVALLDTSPASDR